MKKIVCLILLFVSSYSYASMPDNFCGLQLGMSKNEAKAVIKKKNLSEMKNAGDIHSISYEGKNIELYGICFDNVKIYYDNNERVEGLVFKLFIPYEEGTQRRIFRVLHDEIRPGARSVKDEHIRFNYLFRFTENNKNTYIRISIKEILQGDSGYNIVLTCGPTDKRLN
jgi:hypothetical protein